MERETSERFSEKIMVVDDSEFTRKSIVQILDNHGFNVVGDAESPEKAIQLLGQQEANFFIIDVVIPGMNGLELAKKVNETLPDACIVMISSLHHENIIIESISAGSMDFLKKPFSESELVACVRKVIQIMNKEDE